VVDHKQRSGVDETDRNIVYDQLMTIWEEVLLAPKTIEEISKIVCLAPDIVQRRIKDRPDLFDMQGDKYKGIYS